MDEPGPMGETLRAGLLMEAAQAQQRLGEEALARLDEHLRGLDALVREEVARAVTESLGTLQAETEQAAGALRRLRHSADLRLTLYALVVTLVSLAIGLAAVRVFVPSRRQIELLRARRAAFEADIRHLREFGGSVDLRRCGKRGRLCVRVRRGGPAYGPGGQFLPVEPP
jgi:hypothetical protein